MDRVAQVDNRLEQFRQAIRQDDSTREQAHSEGTPETPTRSEAGVAMQLEVNDLKTKVLRLTEQVTDHIAKLNFLSIMPEKVDLMESRFIGGDTDCQI